MEQEKRNEETKDILVQADRRNKFITVVATTALTVMGAAFVGLAVFAGINLSAERDSLVGFRNEIQAEINQFMGKSYGKPKVVFYAGINNPLENETVLAKPKIKIEEGKRKLHVYVKLTVKNIGNKTAELELIKFYFKKPFKSANESTDEEKYECESYTPRHKIPINILPAGASIAMLYWFDFLMSEIPVGTHPVLAKIYYSKEEPFVCKFNIKIPAQN